MEPDRRIRHVHDKGQKASVLHGVVSTERALWRRGEIFPDLKEVRVLTLWIPGQLERNISGWQ